LETTGAGFYRPDALPASKPTASNTERENYEH